MPYSIILILYSILVLIYIAISIFIVYHLAKYSTNSKFKTLSIVLFTTVSFGLLASNILLFFSINWNELISKVFQ